jgi:hypothetical protein
MGDQDTSTKQAGEAHSVLGHKEDNYEGVIVEPSSLPSDSATFGSALRTSMEASFSSYSVLFNALRDYYYAYKCWLKPHDVLKYGALYFAPCIMR